MADLKTLKVCLSKDLPSLQDRDSNTIYFLRDKLIIYLGKSMYHDPYAIVEDIPSEPITGLLYFLLSDGTVRSYIEYQVITIAQIEDEEQLELLKQTGSIFFVNSQRRYLDLARRIVTLPYNNGTYELTVDMANSLKIDEKTVIGFNPATNMFEMVGDSYNEMIFDYKGKNSNSVNTTVSDKRISSEIKISEVYGNIIKVASDGLYATVDGVSKNQFDSWTTAYREYKTYMEGYLRSLSEKIDDNEQKVSMSTINEKIYNALKEQYNDIEYALDKFNEYSERFEGMENRIKGYSDKQYEDIYTLLSGQIREATMNPWEEFTLLVENPDENIEDQSLLEGEEPKTDENSQETGEGNITNSEPEEDNLKEPVDENESISGELGPDYNTGVEDQGTTNELGDGDDTTPIENNTSEDLPEDNESIQGEDSVTEPEIEENVTEIEDESESDMSSKITETGTSVSGDEEESTDPVNDPNTSTEPENPEENPTNP